MREALRSRNGPAVLGDKKESGGKGENHIWDEAKGEEGEKRAF